LRSTELPKKLLKIFLRKNASTLLEEKNQKDEKCPVLGLSYVKATLPLFEGKKNPPPSF